MTSSSGVATLAICRTRISGATTATFSEIRRSAPSGSPRDKACARKTSFDLLPAGSATRMSRGRGRARSRGSDSAQSFASALAGAFLGVAPSASERARSCGNLASLIASRAVVCVRTLIIVAAWYPGLA